MSVPGDRYLWILLVRITEVLVHLDRVGEGLAMIGGTDEIGAHVAVSAVARPGEVDVPVASAAGAIDRSEEHTSELQSPCNLVCRLLLEKKKKSIRDTAYRSYIKRNAGT